MRLRSRALAAVAAVVALGMTMTLSASTTVAATPKGTLTAPCEKAKTAKLDSGFTCDLIIVPKSKSAALVAKIEASPSQEAALAAAGGEVGECYISGCWEWWTYLHTGYDAVGAYGWRYASGAYQRIGTITIDIDDYITGRVTTKIGFCVKLTHSAWGAYHVVERYFATGANGANGTLPVRKGIESTGKSLTASNLYKYCLPATGNKDFSGKAAANWIADAQTARGTLYHYFTWRTAGFNGKWYVYVKSIIFSRPDASSYLNFFRDKRVPASPANGHWLPN